MASFYFELPDSGSLVIKLNWLTPTTVAALLNDVSSIMVECREIQTPEELEEAKRLYTQLVEFAKTLDENILSSIDDNGFIRFGS